MRGDRDRSTGSVPPRRRQPAEPEWRALGHAAQRPSGHGCGHLRPPRREVPQKPWRRHPPWARNCPPDCLLIVLRPEWPVRIPGDDGGGSHRRRRRARGDTSGGRPAAPPSIRKCGRPWKEDRPAAQAGYAPPAPRPPSGGFRIRGGRARAGRRHRRHAPAAHARHGTRRRVEAETLAGAPEAVARNPRNLTALGQRLMAVQWHDRPDPQPRGSCQPPQRHSRNGPRRLTRRGQGFAPQHPSARPACTPPVLGPSPPGKGGRPRLRRSEQRRRQASRTGKRENAARAPGTQPAKLLRYPADRRFVRLLLSRGALTGTQ